MSSLRKLFAVGSTVAMLAAGLVMPGSALAAAHGAGSVVKTTDGTIWFIDNNGMRSAFTSAGAFQSYGFLSFSQVVDANSDDLALPTGPFIAPRDGSIFCATATKGTDVAGECSLMTGGMKAAFTSASVFSGLGFSFSRAKYGDSSFVAKTSNIGNTSDAHRPGVLVNNHGTVQLVGTSSLLGIPSIDVFNSWGYSFSDVVPANGADQVIPQSGVMVARVPGQLNPSFTSTPQNGQMSVALAGDNPASGTVVTTQAAADLAHFSFTGSGTVTGLTLQRIGVSADASLSRVYLFDGSTRITDAASVSSGSMINFSNASGLFTVNGSKTISVRADLNAQSGETLGVTLNSVTLMGGGSVTGAPVAGNLMTVASANLAAVTFGTVTPSNTNLDPANDQVVWQSTATVATRDVWLTRFALREIGSVNYSDIRNFRLYVDGTQVATQSSLDSNGYVTFALNSPYKLMTGSRVIKVMADIVGGSSRTATFSVRNAADIGLVDSQYNVGIATGTATPIAAGTISINQGSITTQKAPDSPSSTVTFNGSDQTLAKYTLTAYGEPIRIDTLGVQVLYTAVNGSAVGSVRNGRILINGAQYGSTTNISTSGTTTFTVNYTVTPGSPVTVEVRGDAYDADGTPTLAAGDQFQVRMIAGSSNGQGTVSGNVVNVPTTNTDANVVTVASGSLSIAKTSNYTNQSTVVPQTAYKIGSFQVTGSSTEDVNINTIQVDFSTVTGTTFAASKLSNVYIVYGGTRESNTKSSVTATGNTWSVSHTLAKSTSVQVDVYADIASGITANDSIKSRMLVSGTTAQSGQSVSTNTGSVFDGQTITYAAGSLASALDASTPVSKILDDNSTTTVAAFRFTPTNDSYTMTDLTLTLAGSTTVQSVDLINNGTVVQNRPVGSGNAVVFSGMGIQLPANQATVLSFALHLGAVGQNAGTSGEAVTATLTSYKTTSSTGTTATVTPGTAANAMYVYKSIPTVTNSTLPSSLLAAGTQTLAKTTVSTNGTGTVSVAQITWTVSKTSAPTLASFAVYDGDTNTAIAGTITSTGAADVTGSTPLAGTFNATSSGGKVVFTPTSEQEISGAKTFVLKATVGGTLVTGDNVVTTIAQPSSYHTPAAATTIEGLGTAPSFVWSDESAVPHSLASLDWNNDFLVKNLPLDGQTLTK